MNYGLIPAAGKSTRLGGRTKLALPLAGRSVLERVIDALHGGGVEHVLVVIGPHVAELVPLAQNAGAEALLLPCETPDMRATVEAGLCALQERFRPRPNDCWLLVPGDHPTLDGSVIQQLLHAKTMVPERTIVVPSFQGKRGHPTLIEWKHVAEISRWPRAEGINTYLRRSAAETLELPVAADTILADLDTPEDYEKLLQFTATRQLGQAR